MKLNKETFSAKLGMSTSSVYEWEYNRVEIKESTLMLIEFVYNVNPEWLREGKGEMFKPSLIPNAERLMAWLKSLPEDDQTWAVKEIERQIPEFKNWQKI